MEGTLQVEKISIHPGEKIYTWLEVLEDYAGPIRIPLLAINGKRPGKCLYMDSGLYGDEYTGMEAIYQLFRELNPEDLWGQVIAIPMVNTPAFHLISRNGPDGVIMNRTFGGRKEGFLTEKITHFVLEKIVPHADYAIQIIDIGMYYAITSFVALVQKGGQINMDYAKAYGCDLLWSEHAFPTTNVRRAIAQKGVDIIMTELGGEGRCHEEHIAYEVRGLKNLLKFLKILKGDLEGLPPNYRIGESFWMHSQTGGIFRSNLKLRQEVKKGEKLASIYNLLDQELEVIRAPHDGVIIGYRTVPRIHPGDWTVWVGKILREEGPLSI